MQAGGGKKKKAAKVATRSFVKQTNPTPELPTFRVRFGSLLEVELHAPQLPRMFPIYDEIERIRFSVQFYTTPLENNNILSRLNFAQFTNLQSFELSTPNVITGTLPTSLFILPNVFDIIIIDNKDLTGEIPNLPSRLRNLNLSNNGLSGPIPNLLDTRLQMLKLDKNQLSGNIPALPPSLFTVELNHNMLDGVIPHLPNDLRRLNLSNNRLSGQLPELLPPALSEFRVNNNQLSGVIPQCIHRRMYLLFKISGNNFFSEDESDALQSLGNLLIMVRRGFVNFIDDPEFYEAFDEMPPEIQAAKDKAKLTYLLQRFEASAPTLMG
jgi:hypothetical protein